MKKIWFLTLSLFMGLSQSVFSSATDQVNKLRVYDETNGNELKYATSNYQEITQTLNSIDIRFEKWQANMELQNGASQQEVLEAYKEDVERLVLENGYQSIDVVRIFPDAPKKEEIRNKFLNEHTHDNDEVRFFVEGSGLFYIHHQNEVYIVLCEKGDLISIPATYTHWFDMGDKPYFTAIRFFINSDGWIPKFTGSDISQSFPKFGE